jgi:hypothetical protein
MKLSNRSILFILLNSRELFYTNSMSLFTQSWPGETYQTINIENQPLIDNNANNPLNKRIVRNKKRLKQASKSWACPHSTRLKTKRRK